MLSLIHRRRRQVLIVSWIHNFASDNKSLTKGPLPHRAGKSQGASHRLTTRRPVTPDRPGSMLQIRATAGCCAQFTPRTRRLSVTICPHQTRSEVFQELQGTAMTGYFAVIYKKRVYRQTLMAMTMTTEDWWWCGNGMASSLFSYHSLIQRNIPSESQDHWSPSGSALIGRHRPL